MTRPTTKKAVFLLYIICLREALCTEPTVLHMKIHIKTTEAYSESKSESSPEDAVTQASTAIPGNQGLSNNNRTQLNTTGQDTKVTAIPTVDQTPISLTSNTALPCAWCPAEAAPESVSTQMTGTGNDVNVTDPLGPKDMKSDVPAGFILYETIRTSIREGYMPVFMAIGLLGNLVNLVVLHQKDMSRSSSNTYLAGLGWLDFFFVLTYVLPILAQTGLLENPAFYKFYIHSMISNFLVTTLTQTASRWVTVSLTIERFLAVTFPLRATALCTVRRARLTIIGLCISSFAINIMSVFRWKSVERRDPRTGRLIVLLGFSEFGLNKTVASVTFWIYLFIKDLIPMILMAVFNSLLISNLRKSGDRRKQMSSTNQKLREDRERSITITLVSVVVVYFLLNFCDVVLTFLGSNFLEYAQGSIYWKWRTFALIADTLSGTTAAANFFVYSFSSSQFRKVLKKLVRICFRMREP